MRKNLLLPLVLLLILFSTCKKEDVLKSSANVNNPAALEKGGNDKSQSGHIKIAVLSDIHYMDSTQLINGAQARTPFKTAIIPNKAMQEYSAPIFRSVLADLKNEHPDIVLIAGDMTMNGEQMNHKTMAQKLQELQDAGSKVYVIPGNNDINSPDAVIYDGNTTSSIPNVNATEFTDIYQAFGYDATTIKDPSSLSYVAKPYPNLWILAIDAVKYAPYSRGGSIKDATMEWIRTELDTAKRNNITVLGLMHHNLLEHYLGQSGTKGIAANTVLENNMIRTEALISAGLQVIFTGHNHATDVTSYTYNGKTLYDIETGSLITPPSPYRIMFLKNKELDFSTRYVTTIDKLLPGDSSFTDYSDQAFSSLLDRTYHLYLVPMFKIRPTLVDSVTPMAIAAYKAHTAGDEKISPAQQAQLNTLNTINPLPTSLITVLSSLWIDLGVKDQKWHIKLEGR